MKKITLSLVVAAIAASASTITLYQDLDTGAIYTKPGANRVELGDFISAKDVYVENEMIKSKMSKALKGTVVKSKVKTLKFSGKHYLGFTSINYEDDRDTVNRFETRRNYFQVKAYWNKKDYARITLDTFLQYKDTNSKDDGSWLVRLKYAYIYLDNILPYTGVEFGQAHRPWIDWEEHHGWFYRSIAKTFIEAKKGAHLINSADLGVNFKTNTEYFSSEIGVYNGEGYHSETANSNTDLSFEARLTAHILGTGKNKKPKPQEDSYADISFLMQYSTEHKNTNNDLKWYGIHAVYNQPLFLLAGMYLKSDNDNGEYEGKGWSINGEFRPVKEWSILARYDKWDVEEIGEEKTRKEYIVGAVYNFNKNVKLIGNIFGIDPDDSKDNDEEIRYMFTAEVKW